MLCARPQRMKMHNRGAQSAAGRHSRAEIQVRSPLELAWIPVCTGMTD